MPDSAAHSLRHTTARNILLRILAAAAFLVLFQAYLVAPLIPALARDYRASASLLGLMVPAYTIPYGLSTLFTGHFLTGSGESLVAKFIQLIGCGLLTPCSDEYLIDQFPDISLRLVYYKFFVPPRISEYGLPP